MSIKKLWSKQPFYKQPIQKPCVKKLSNHELLRELPFYDDINILRKERAFTGYTETYKVEVIDNKSLSDLLYESKYSIKNIWWIIKRKKGF